MMQITKHGPEAIGELRPLWLAMVHHHHEVAPGMGEIYSDDETWERRSAAYAKFLAEPDAFVLVARDEDGRAVGYAVVTLDPGSPTFVEPRRFGFVGSLSVLPQTRGQGTGRALLERAQSEIEALGCTELRLDVLSGNTRALDFYAGLGFTPYVVGLRRPERPI